MTKLVDENSGPRSRIVEVGEDYAGQRLDNFLQRELKGLPKTRLYRALRKGEVRVNKGRSRADYRLKAGDKVRIPPLRLADPSEPPKVPRHWSKRLEQSVFYEDDALLVINKPAGLAVHGGSGLDFGLIECLRQLRPDDRYLELVHRIDRETSGCLMVARKPAALRDLHQQLRENRVDKRYLALVHGNWSSSRGHVDAPLQKNTLKSGERVVRVDREGKAARTDFRVLQRFEGCTLLEAKPLSGRTHQIRVHALHAGHPLMGDEKYTSREQLQWTKQQGLKRMFLHAASLRFQHGDKGKLSVECPLDQELESFLERIAKD